MACLDVTLRGYIQVFISKLIKSAQWISRTLQWATSVLSSNPNPVVSPSMLIVISTLALVIDILDITLCFCLDFPLDGVNPDMVG